MTPTPAMGAASAARACSNEAPAGFQNSASGPLASDTVVPPSAVERGPTGMRSSFAPEVPVRSSDPADKRRVIYALTDKGAELLPVLLALRQWGEEWGYGKMEIVLADRRDRRPVRKICVMAHDGRELKLGDLTWIDRDGGSSVLRTAAE